ncbi:GTP-binding protein [Candidatus Halobeggiatoa sp. HSG11]|nr:GTP-binding protein [Candidatus Halobeggiatoa sp. HSG11]
MLASESSKELIPIHIVTGFLGSGKTTLLNQLLQQPEMQNTIVIINEFGEISVDHLLIETTTEDMMILEGGCVCCAIRTDLLNTLEELFHKRDRQEINEFKQIVVETTGLADPAPILRTLINDQFVATYYRLDTIVTTVDAVYAIQQSTEYDESVKQIALANHLILTKIDLVNDNDLDILISHLEQINPTAKLHKVNLQKQHLKATDLFDNEHYDKQTQQLDINHWLKVESHTNHIHNTYIRTFCIEHQEPLHWLTLEHWIQQLTRLRGKDLLRVKGIAYTYETDLPVIIQGVQHIFQPPTTLKAWPDDKRCSQIVFITRSIEKQLVEKVLQAIINSKNSVDICNAALLLL